MDENVEVPSEPSELTRRDLLRASLAAGVGVYFLGFREGSALAGLGKVRPKRGGILRFELNDASPSETLNPFRTFTNFEVVRGALTHDPLFGRDFNNNAAPRLALSAEPGKNASVWKVTLRSGVTFHKGQPLTAQDVLWSYALGTDPKISGGA